jgi:tripeptidyl-peptidase I
MRLLFLSLVFSFVINVYSSPTNLHVLHEKRSRPPPDWIQRSKLDRQAVIPLRIALKQRNLDRVNDFMYDVSHPNSAKYGQHWTAKQVAETFAPR